MRDYGAPSPRWSTSTVLYCEVPVSNTHWLQTTNKTSYHGSIDYVRHVWWQTDYCSGLCDFSGFCRGVVFLCYLAALLIGYKRFGTARRFHPQGSSSSWSTKSTLHIFENLNHIQNTVILNAHHVKPGCGCFGNISKDVILTHNNVCRILFACATLAVNSWEAELYQSLSQKRASAGIPWTFWQDPHWKGLQV
jgi:hypothetical protein